jgi:hypothetical protein
MEAGGKIRPYEHLSDAELNEATRLAAELQLRMIDTDARDVLRVLVDNGCPRADALGMLNNPQMRLGAFRFYFDTIDAALGDKDAKYRVEHVTVTWSRMREGRRLAAVNSDGP